MKLQFKNQVFQEAATAAVCDVFEGQPYHDPNVYTVDPGTGGHAGRRVTLPKCAMFRSFCTIYGCALCRLRKGLHFARQFDTV